MMIEQGLATATASDRGTVAMLTTMNSKLASQLEAAQAYIKTLKDEIVAIKRRLNLLGKVNDR
jgi:hypothetical protein